jgi:hypothetical protein
LAESLLANAVVAAIRLNTAWSPSCYTQAASKPVHSAYRDVEHAKQGGGGKIQDDAVAQQAAATLICVAATLIYVLQL